MKTDKHMQACMATHERHTHSGITWTPLCVICRTARAWERKERREREQAATEAARIAAGRRGKPARRVGE